MWDIKTQWNNQNNNILIYEEILESVIDIVALLNDELEFIYINHASLNKYLGYNSEDILYKNLLKFVYNKDLNQINTFIKSLFKQNQYQTTIRLQHKNGNFLWFDIIGRLFINEENKKKIILIFKEISNLKDKEISGKNIKKNYKKLSKDLIEIQYWKLFQPKNCLLALQGSQGMLSSVMNNIPQLIAWKDPELKYLGCNDNYAHFLGNSDPSYIIGKTDGELNWAFTSIKDLREKEKRVIETGIPEYHKIEKWQESINNEVYLSINRIPLFNSEGKILGILLTYEDITERKSAEQKLEELKQQLEKRVKDRTIKLESSEKKYRKAYNRTNCFKGLFTHDISNIFHTIGNSIELSGMILKNGIITNDILDYFNLIEQQLSRGRKLIENIRNLSEIEESEMPIESVEVFNYLRKAIEFMKVSFQKQDINVQIDSNESEIYVLANDLLLDVFENIMINSVHYNKNETVEIEIKISKILQNNKNYIKLEFKDNGIGIEDYRKDQIFQTNFQRRLIAKGMGLGLSLVAKFIELCEGKIWVEDRINGDYTKGSNFIVLIPEAKK